MRNQRWTLDDVARIMSPHRPLDRVLARVLKRSVQAIQIKRTYETKRRQHGKQSPWDAEAA